MLNARGMSLCCRISSPHSSQSDVSLAGPAGAVERNHESPLAFFARTCPVDMCGKEQADFQNAEPKIINGPEVLNKYGEHVNLPSTKYWG